MDSSDLAAVWLTLKLATLVTLLLLVIGTPVAWWLARTHSRLKGVVGAVVALPLVLPPTVIGFYLLVVMGPQGPIGQLTQALGLGLLPFTFPGLVVASVFYSLHLAPRFTRKMDNITSCFLVLGKFQAVHQKSKKIDMRASKLSIFFQPQAL